MTLKEEAILKQRLQAEGRQNEPAFSPLLHERIMTALRAAGTGHTPESSNSTEDGWKLWQIVLPLAAAAAIAVVTWLNVRPVQPESIPGFQVSLPSFPREIMDPVRDLAPSAASIDEAKFAYLDRDAYRLATFVADQLPGFAVTDKDPSVAAEFVVQCQNESEQKAERPAAIGSPGAQFCGFAVREAVAYRAA